MVTAKVCEHIKEIKSIKQPEAYECSVCIANGTDWVHLRTCQTCGITLCCDDSPHRHMTAHYHHTQHPVVISAEPGEAWMWCYPHQLFVEYQ